MKYYKIVETICFMNRDTNCASPTDSVLIEAGGCFQLGRHDRATIVKLTNSSVDTVHSSEFEQLLLLPLEDEEEEEVSEEEVFEEEEEDNVDDGERGARKDKADSEDLTAATAMVDGRNGTLDGVESSRPFILFRTGFTKHRANMDSRT